MIFFEDINDDIKNEEMLLKWLLNILKHRKSTKTKKAYIVAVIHAQLCIVYTQLVHAKSQRIRCSILL